MAANSGQLIEAVNALYNHPDEKVKKQANHWLEQWQQSLEAWSVSDAILHDRNSPFDAQYFCAQTLRTKVGFCISCLLENPWMQTAGMLWFLS